MQIALIVLVLLYSVILHEIAHGLVARWNGDPTAKLLGRLTLNPVSHVDFFGTLVLPALLIFLQSPVLFAWAKPVPYNPRYFKNLKIGLLTVSLAGVALNALLVLFFAQFLRRMPDDPFWTPVWTYGFSINLVLAIFNLIPIPPLDGSRALSVFLPKRLAARYLLIERAGLILIFALLYFGLLGKAIMPIYQKVAGWLLK